MSTSVTPAFVELWLVFNDTPELALSIPRDKCYTLAVYPLKWLRFLGYAVFGREGCLSTSSRGPPIQDYTAEIAGHSYYFISEEPPCLADIDAMDDRTSDASTLSTLRADFRNRIVDRDVTCVSTTELTQNCDACHIISHSKGDKYIYNALSHRSGGDLVDQLDGINDTRNGLLLCDYMHRRFGDGAVAFLKTPNFGLSVDDIPYSTASQENQASPTSRLTVHYMIDEILGITVKTMVSNNSDLRKPTDTSMWPPDIILNLSYAAAALRAWAPMPFKQHARMMTKDAYYPAPDNISDHSNAEPGRDEGPLPPPEPSARQKRLDARNAKKAQGAGEEMNLSSALDVVLALWMRSARQGEANQPRTTDSDVAHSRDKVQAWMDSQDSGFNHRNINESM